MRNSAENVSGYPDAMRPSLVQACRLEGNPSSRQACTLLAGRKSFQPSSLYLAGWKEILPAVKPVPCQLEGNPSS
jgi:hypothetical protein